MKHFAIFLILSLIYTCTGKQSPKVEKSKHIAVRDSNSLFINYSKPRGKTIKFPEVNPADSFLHVDTAKNVFENKIGKKIYFFPQELKNYSLAPCFNNGLIQTIQECYDNHRPLILTPDIIWLAICQGVSIHVNEKMDSLENIIFFKKKPAKIELRNDFLEYRPDAWASLVQSISTETRKYTKDDLYSFFVPTFTTTTSINSTAYNVTLLECYKKVFQYIGDTGCGIPAITITGERNDWQLMMAKLEMLDKLGLVNWKKNLKPIIQEFINVFDGKTNQEFWQSIYKNASEYNAFYISGWIIKLFPYIKVLEQGGVLDEKTGTTKIGEKYKSNPFLDGDSYLMSTLATDNFPSGMAKIEIIWNNFDRNFTKKMEMYAGFFAIKQYPDKTLEPFISWVLCKKDTIEPNHKTVPDTYRVQKHSEEFWSPHIVESLTDSAIYDIKTFSNQKESIEFLKSEIKNSIKKTPKFRYHNFKKDSVEFIVLANGSIADLKIKGEKNKLFAEFVKGIILKMPEKWFPALANPTNALNLMDYQEDKKDIKIKVNSKVKFALK